jgi:hypothetical protein
MSDDVQRFSDLLRFVAACGLQRGFQLSYEECGLLSIPALQNAGLFGASLAGVGIFRTLPEIPAPISGLNAREWGRLLYNFRLNLFSRCNCFPFQPYGPY